MDNPTLKPAHNDSTAAKFEPLNFITDGSLERILARKQRTEDLRRENFKRALDRMDKDCFEMQQNFRDLLRSGADVSGDLKELETVANSLMLVALVLKHESGRE